MKRVLRTFHTSFLGLCLLALVFVGSPGCGCCGDGSSGTLDYPGECCCEFNWIAPAALAGHTVQIVPASPSSPLMDAKIRVPGQASPTQSVLVPIPATPGTDPTVAFFLCVNEEAASGLASLTLQCTSDQCTTCGPLDLCWTVKVTYVDSCKPEIEKLQCDPDLSIPEDSPCYVEPIKPTSWGKCCDFEWKAYCWLDDEDVTFEIVTSTPAVLAPYIHITGRPIADRTFHLPPTQDPPEPVWVPFTICVQDDVPDDVIHAEIVFKCTTPACTPALFCPDHSLCWEARVVLDRSRGDADARADLEILRGAPMLRTPPGGCDITEWCGCYINMTWEDPLDIIGGELKIRLVPADADFPLTWNPDTLEGLATAIESDYMFFWFQADSDAFATNAAWIGEVVKVQAWNFDETVLVSEAELTFDTECRPILNPESVWYRHPDVPVFTWIYDESIGCNCVSAGFCD